MKFYNVRIVFLASAGTTDQIDNSGGIYVISSGSTSDRDKATAVVQAASIAFNAQQQLGTKDADVYAATKPVVGDAVQYASGLLEVLPQNP